MANLLTSMGWPCGHEAVFGPEGLERAVAVISGGCPHDNSPISRLGGVLSDGMDLVGDSSYMAAPFLDKVDAMIIHVVRNPIPVVASLVGGVFRNFAESKPVDYEDMPDHIKYERFMYDHVPDLSRDMPQLDRACVFYLRWNEMIESSGRVDLFHRIEDPPNRISKLLRHDGDFFSEPNCNSFAESSRMWSLSQVEDPAIRRQMRDIMKRYGYEEEAPLL